MSSVLWWVHFCTEITEAQFWWRCEARRSEFICLQAFVTTLQESLLNQILLLFSRVFALYSFFFENQEPWIVLDCFYQNDSIQNWESWMSKITWWKPLTQASCNIVWYFTVLKMKRLKWSKQGSADQHLRNPGPGVPWIPGSKHCAANQKLTGDDKILDDDEWTNPHLINCM